MRISDWSSDVCSSDLLQVTGGYFCVPGLKEVPDVHAAGFPITQIDADGEFIISKADATGGAVDARTVKEQLLYEVHDRAEERRVGKECGSTCRSRWSTYN